MDRPFTGWHMLGMMVAFFGVVIAVNFTMAAVARSSFGGVVVENSYVASQEFNGWLDQAESQAALGWDVSVGWQDGSAVTLDVTGAPDPLVISANARHPLGRLPDREMVFDRVAPGHYRSRTELPAGRWTLRLQLSSGDSQWRHEEQLQ
ncbi:FixH family protein [Alteraurantiacibacter aestuarii]|uniref:FixH family protein n=1 Tax=Alteraurantiacibacter aestuarii TaxID=650004 RepID=UPI0031CF881B